MEGGDYEPRLFGNCRRTVYRLGSIEPRSARRSCGIHLSAVRNEGHEGRSTTACGVPLYGRFCSGPGRRRNDLPRLQAFAQGCAGGDVARPGRKAALSGGVCTGTLFEQLISGRFDEWRVTFGECPERHLRVLLIA